jgi:hypothetical protein
MLVDLLLPFDDEDPQIEVLLSHIIRCYRYVRTDMAIGNLAVERRAKRQEDAGGSPDEIQKTLAAKDSVYWVVASDQSPSDERLGFLITPERGIFVSYPSEANQLEIKELVDELAEVVECSVIDWTMLLEVVVNTDLVTGIASELNLQKDLASYLHQKRFGYVSKYTPYSGGLTFSFETADVQEGPECLLAILQRMFGVNSVTVTPDPSSIPWYL